MILQSLVDYYEVLSREDKTPKQGYGIAGVSFALSLTKEGALISVIPLRLEVQRGKKAIQIPQRLQVPEPFKRSSGVQPNFLCDNCTYVLGIDTKGKSERAIECFEAFKAMHHKILDGIDCEEAKAVLTFLDKSRPEDAKNNALFADNWDILTSGVNLVFYVAGAQGYVHEHPEIRKEWELYKENMSSEQKRQCLVTGEVRSVARLHPSIKGVRGSQSMGASIVSFNARAYESYGYDGEQGLNAPVSEYATFAYTTALNYLLADADHVRLFGDTTIVYWAKNPDPIYSELFGYSLDPVMTIDDDNELLLRDTFVKIVEGAPIDDVSDKIDPETRFYILGLAPNAARLSVRFFLQDTFGSFMKCLKQHYNYLEIERSPKDFEYLPLWKLLSETVSPNSKDKASSPLLSGSVLRSIFAGGDYPEALFLNVLLRIRAEQNINRGKAAIIKAYLIKNKDYKEELQVSLNEQSDNKAYVLGRLFAVLEKVQKDAYPTINATIKDRYFMSACAAPASVFPILIRLSNVHLRIVKRENGKFGFAAEKRIRELMDKLDIESDPFPAHFSLENQGLFALGYYHQQNANYRKQDKEEEKNDESN